MSETRVLAEYVVDGRLDDIPDDVRHEARRALLNYVGCALGGCTHPAMDAALRAFAPLSGPPVAAVLGRSDRLDPLHASLLNGIAAHVLDYDDTTPKNYSHPTAPVASALFACASAQRVRGTAFLEAFVFGFEVESRVADAVYPAHYDAGWHITGTAGVFGAAAAIGRLMGLTVPEMVWALGLAATQASGLREMFGSMAKAFHPGRAAQNGYAAALLAQAGFTAGERGIEGPRGFAAVQASRSDLSRITTDLGVAFSLRENTYKPYPCGIVNHPTIEACIRMHQEQRIDPAAITGVHLRVAPLVLDLCNQQRITRGLQGKFSVYHGAAVGLVRGRAGLREYTDETVNDPAVRRVREMAVATADPSFTEDQAQVEVELADGRRLTGRIDESLGNLKRPLSDAHLEEKFDEQAALILADDQVRALRDLCWGIDQMDHVGVLVAATTPSQAAAGS